MTQEKPQTVSEMLRVTAENSSEFYKQIAIHIEQLEETIAILEAKLLGYQDIEEKENDDHK